MSQRIRRKAFPYVWWRRLRHRVAPPPFAVPMRALPWRLRRMMRRTFTTGLRWPGRRPTPRQWVTALERAEAATHPCRRSAHHIRMRRWSPCPWCVRVDRGVADPFPGPERIGVTRRPPARWRIEVARVRIAWARLPAPPARPVIAAAAGVVGIAAPLLALLAASVGVLVHSRLKDARAVGTVVAMTIGATPAVVAASLVIWTPPNVVVFGARIVGGAACAALVARLPIGARWGRVTRWRVGAATLAAGFIVTRVGAWWWPLAV